MRRINIIVVLIFTINASVQSDTERKCKGLYFNRHYYELEIIKEGVYNLHQLAVNNNILYFSYDLLENTSATAYLNLETKEIGVIDGVKNARAITVDRVNNIVYIGGDTGLYSLNRKNVPHKTSVSLDVLKLFYSNNGPIYFTTSDKKAFIYAPDDGRNVVNELVNVTVDALAVDETQHIFFIDNKQLFRVHLGTLAVNIHENYAVNSVATDLYGKLYVCADDGVYVYNEHDFYLYKIANLYRLKDIAFDAMNNPLYAVDDKIVRLRYVSKRCVE